MPKFHLRDLFTVQILDPTQRVLAGLRVGAGGHEIPTQVVPGPQIEKLPSGDLPIWRVPGVSWLGG